MIREPIYAALFAKLAAAATFKTASRKLKHYSEVSPPDQPALFMAQITEDPRQQTKLPPLWHMKVECYVYARVEDTEIPGQIINTLLDALTNAIAPLPAFNQQTLGGLVHNCWIDGVIDIFEGLLANQVVVIIPITITVPYP